MDDRQIHFEVKELAPLQFKEILNTALSVDAPAVGIERRAVAAQKRADMRPLDVKLAAVEPVYATVDSLSGAEFRTVLKNVVDRLDLDRTHILPFGAGWHIPGPEPDIECRLFGGIDEGIKPLVRRSGLDGEIHIEAARAAGQHALAAGQSSI